MKTFASTGGLRRNFRASRSSVAFSLVEVVMALGVVAFGIMAIVALLPMGMKMTRDSLEETRAINLLSNVIADRKASTDYAAPSLLYKLPALNAAVTNTFVTTESLASDPTQAHYLVTCIVLNQPTGMEPYQVYFKVSWPPAVTANPAGYVEATVAFPQP